MTQVRYSVQDEKGQARGGNSGSASRDDGTAVEFRVNTAEPVDGRLTTGRTARHYSIKFSKGPDTKGVIPMDQSGTHVVCGPKTGRGGEGATGKKNFCRNADI